MTGHRLPAPDWYSVPATRLLAFTGLIWRRSDRKKIAGRSRHFREPFCDVHATGGDVRSASVPGDARVHVSARIPVAD